MKSISQHQRQVGIITPAMTAEQRVTGIAEQASMTPMAGVAGGAHRKSVKSRNSNMERSPALWLLSLRQSAQDRCIFLCHASVVVTPRASAAFSRRVRIALPSCAPSFA